MSGPKQHLSLPTRPSFDFAQEDTFIILQITVSQSVVEEHLSLTPQPSFDFAQENIPFDFAQEDMHFDCALEDMFIIKY